jgi:hypothetical protein
MPRFDWAYDPNAAESAESISVDPSKLLEALAALAMLAKEPSQDSDSASGYAVVDSQVRQVVPAYF